MHFSCWELETKLCGLLVGWAEVIRQKVSFSLVCVCVCVCVCACVCVCLWGGGRAGWALSDIKCCSGSKIFITLIFHDHLHYCEIFFARFLISFVFNKAAVAFDF